MEQRIEQLIEMCIQSDGEPKLFETLYQCLKQNNIPYYIKSLQLLNDLIQYNHSNPKIFNYILKYFQFNKLSIDLELDSLILIQWLQNISIQNWKLLIIVWKLSNYYPQLKTKQFMELLNHFPSNQTHFPSFIILKIFQNYDFKDLSFNSLTVYTMDHIIINNKEMIMGPIYVQIIHKSLFLYIGSTGMLLEIYDFQYYQNGIGKHNKEIILVVNDSWLLFDKNEKFPNFAPVNTTTNNNNKYIPLCFQNLKTITLLSPFAEPNKYRVSTSKTMLKLNGNLTPSQESIVITKCNDVSTTDNIKKNIKKRQINDKNKVLSKKVSNEITKYKDSKIVASKIKKFPSIKNNNKKNKNKKNHIINGKNLKPLKQGHLENYKPVITIESSQLNKNNNLLQPQTNNEIVKKEKISNLEKDNITGNNSTTILANNTTITNGIAMDPLKKDILNKVNHEDEEDIIPINNPAIPNNESIKSSPLISPYDFTDLLQKQIQQSINSFTIDLVSKVEMINQEVKQNLIKPLTMKYNRKIEDLQEEFRRDTDSLVVNFQEMITKLHWNQKDLLKFLENSRRTT